MALSFGSRARRDVAIILEFSRAMAERQRRLLMSHGVSVLDWRREGAGWGGSFKTHKPGILIADLQLPKRDGLGCIVEALKIDPNVKVVFTHAYTGALANDVEIMALKLGAAAVLQKPFGDDRFNASIRKVLSMI